ncbi:MAG: hypothetical protein J6Y24_16175 [Bacteroidales bacterium]|nr:hypothetical protein [Bacteroidales bacterium]
MRHLLSEKWVNTAIECCVSQRRYQHWVMESFSKSMVCRWYKERKNADFLRDSEGEPDLEQRKSASRPF